MAKSLRLFDLMGLKVFHFFGSVERLTEFQASHSVVDRRYASPYRESRAVLEKVAEPVRVACGDNIRRGIVEIVLPNDAAQFRQMSFLISYFYAIPSLRQKLSVKMCSD